MDAPRAVEHGRFLMPDDSNVPTWEHKLIEGVTWRSVERLVQQHRRIGWEYVDVLRSPLGGPRIILKRRVSTGESRARSDQPTVDRREAFHRHVPAMSMNFAGNR
jgi:hypothetical protein